MIEIVPKRTPNSKTFSMLDGTYQTVIYSGGPIHFEDENGNLQNIDTRLFDAAEFDFVDLPVSSAAKETFYGNREMVRAAKAKQALNTAQLNYHALGLPYHSELPRQFRRGWSVEYGDSAMHIKPVGASPAIGHPDEDSPAGALLYQDAWNDVDVRLELTFSGVKASYILKTDRAPSSFTFEIRGEIGDDLKAGSFRLEPAWLEDAKGDRRDVLQKIRRENGKTYLDVVADVTGLEYPVLIDPTTTIQPDSSAGWDNRLDPTAPYSVFANDTAMSLGTDSIGQNVRGILQFDLSSITGPISSATLTLTVTSGSNVAANQCYLYRNTASWSPSTVTWNNAPAYASTNSGTDYVQFSIPGSPGNPWNYPINLNVTSMVSSWQTGASPNYGWTLVIGSGFTNTWKYIGASNNSDAGVRPKLVITWNQPPGAPTVTAPAAGAQLNAQHTLTCTAASDTDTAQSSLQYNWELTTNGGGSWKTIIGLTSPGVTSPTYDFTNEAETTLGQVRCRAFDGASYGPWAYSGTFSIVHNVAPLKPTNLTRSNFDATQDADFIATFNDTAGDGISAQDVEIYNTKNTSTPVYSLSRSGTAVAKFTVPANTLINGESYQWRTRHYDKAGVPSPWSDYAGFKCSKTPTVTVLDPTAGKVVPSDTIVVKGSYSQVNGVVQKSFRARLWDQTGTTILQDGPEILGYNNEVSFFGLTNNTGYMVDFIATSKDDMTSVSAKVPFSVSYTPPGAPTIVLTNEPDQARVKIVMTNVPGTTNHVRNSSFKVITATGQVFYNALTSATGWTVVSGSGTVSPSGMAITANGTIWTSGNSAWKPMTGSGGQNLALTMQATFTTPATLSGINGTLYLLSDANNYYRAQINNNSIAIWKKVGGGALTNVATSGVTTISASTTYTMTLSRDTAGVLTAKLYSGTSATGTPLQTLTATDTALAGGFLIGVGGDAGVVVTNAKVTAAVPDTWSLGGNVDTPFAGAWALVIDPVYGYVVNGIHTGTANSFSACYHPTTIPITGGKTYTLSVKVKAPIGSTTRINLYDPATDTSTQVKTPGTGNWQTVSVSVTFSSTSSQARVYLYSADNGPGNTVYYTDVQVEDGSIMTPYLRNDSTTMSATRPAAASNNLYRRKVGETEWKLVQQAVIATTLYDYECPTGEYEYGATATSSANAVSSYGMARLTHFFYGIWTIDVDDPENGVLWLYNQEGESYTVESSDEVIVSKAEKPFVRRGPDRYRSGELSARFFMNTSGDIETIEERIKSMCAADQPCLLKMPSGDQLYVALMKPSIHKRYGASMMDASVTWVEVEPE